MHAVFEYFLLPRLIFSLDSSHDWVVSLNSENLVSNLVELFHLAFSQQSAEFLYIFSLLEGTCNCEFLLFLHSLVSIVVPDGDVLPTVLLLLPAERRVLPRLTPHLCTRKQVT